MMNANEITQAARATYQDAIEQGLLPVDALDNVGEKVAELAQGRPGRFDQETLTWTFDDETEVITISKYHKSDFGMSGSYTTSIVELHLREDGPRLVRIEKAYDNATRETAEDARDDRPIGEREVRKLLAGRSALLERFESWNATRKSA